MWMRIEEREGTIADLRATIQVHNICNHWSN